MLTLCVLKMWYDYDDSSVTKINLANLPTLAFGGEYTHTVTAGHFDANLKFCNVIRYGTNTKRSMFLESQLEPTTHTCLCMRKWKIVTL